MDQHRELPAAGIPTRIAMQCLPCFERQPQIAPRKVHLWHTVPTVVHMMNFRSDPAGWTCRICSAGWTCTYDAANKHSIRNMNVTATVELTADEPLVVEDTNTTDGAEIMTMSGSRVEIMSGCGDNVLQQWALEKKRIMRLSSELRYTCSCNARWERRF